jgi:hypothetical protein
MKIKISEAAEHDLIDGNRFYERQSLGVELLEEPDITNYGTDRYALSFDV